jgi:Bacterial PH domain
VSAPPPLVRIFRLPALAYIIVLLLLLGSIPIAFTGHGIEGETVVVGPQTLVLLIPIITAVFIARTATIVDAQGITVRAAFGRRRLAWNDIRGLSVTRATVYAALADGAIRLPCVRVPDLAAISRVSAGRLPEIPEAPPKFAPQRRLRR